MLVAKRSFIAASLFILTLSPQAIFAWGEQGHRAVGDIAEKRLKPEVRAKVQALLGKETLADATTWADQVRSDRQYDYMKPWHYVTIPDGETYNQSAKNPNGDLIAKTVEIIKAMSGSERAKLSASEQLFYLRLLAHFIGDIHQPLHVSTAKDRGGNLCYVRFFGAEVNLHTLWDSKLLERDDQKVRLAEVVDTPARLQALSSALTSKTSVLSWAQESQDYRDSVYPPPKSRDYCQASGGPVKASEAFDYHVHDSHESDDEAFFRLSYEMNDLVRLPKDSLPELGEAYHKRHVSYVHDRILTAGIRLADTLNKLFK
jgi:hypothetical protein